MSAKIANFQCIVDNPGQSNAVVLFHGYGADNSDLAPLSRFLDPKGEWTWVFPNGPMGVDVGMGFMGRAWFALDQRVLQEVMASGQPSDVAREYTPEFEQALLQLKPFVDQLKKNHSNLVFGGFSQGGMVASHLLADGGSQIQGAILLSTILVGRKQLKEKLTGVEAKSFFQSHGIQDAVLGIKNARQLYDTLRELKWQGCLDEFSGGHEIPMSVLEKAKAYLEDLAF